MAEKNEELLSLNSKSIDDDSSDEDDSVNLCGTEDQYLAIFKACQNQLVKDLNYKKGSDEIKDKTQTHSNIPEKKSKLEKKGQDKDKGDKKLKKDSSDDEDSVLPVVKQDTVNKDIIFLDDEDGDDEVIFSARVPKRSRRKSPLVVVNKGKGRNNKSRGRGRPKKSSNNSTNNNDIVPITLDDDSEDESNTGKSNGFKSKVDEPLITFEDLEPEPFMFTVLVRFDEKVHKFRVSSDERVAKCKVHLSTTVKIDQDDLIIFRDRVDYEIVDETKTFEEADIGCDIILEAFKKSHPIVKIMTGQAGSSQDQDPNMIRLKLQGSTKADLLILEFNKSRPFSDLCKRYAEKKKLDPSKIKLKFDGDFLDMTSNCVDEDLEGDEVIDVIIKD